MKRRYYAAAIAILTIAAGCATYGELEKDYGKSYSLAKKGQILNPAAPSVLKPATGLSGDAAELAIQKYTQSFDKNGNNQANKNLFVPLVSKPGSQP